MQVTDREAFIEQVRQAIADSGTRLEELRVRLEKLKDRGAVREANVDNAVSAAADAHERAAATHRDAAEHHDVAARIHDMAAEEHEQAIGEGIGDPTVHRERAAEHRAAGGTHRAKAEEHRRSAESQSQAAEEDRARRSGERP